MFGICSLSLRWDCSLRFFFFSNKLNLLIIGVLSEHAADAFSKGDYCGFRQYRGPSLDEYCLSSCFLNSRDARAVVC
jgi:hypothetical protein